MRFIQLKKIRNVALLLILIAVGVATPNLVTRYSVSMAQGRGQLTQASRNYELGVQAGRQDARRNLSNNYLRHTRQFNARWETDFREGYLDGYENRSVRGYSDRGYGSRPYGYGNDPFYGRGSSSPYGYTSAGSMIWRGRVDHYVELRIQGDRVQSRERQGAPTLNEGARFTSPLPRADSQVFVSKRQGRGQVGVIQQPSRWNGYTAVIAINDESGGADNYEIEVAWR